MATYCGNGGEVWAKSYTEGENALYADLLANVRTWQMTENANVNTANHSSSVDGWGDSCVGTKNWSGSFEMYNDDSGIDPVVSVGDKLSVTLIGDAGVGGAGPADPAKTLVIKGTVIVTDVNYNVDIEGGGFVYTAVSFTGTGAPEVSNEIPATP